MSDMKRQKIPAKCEKQIDNNREVIVYTYSTNEYRKSGQNIMI